MEYLFLRRRKGTSTSPRQKDLLFKAVEKQWRKEFLSKGIEGREIDFEIYRSILYLLEIRQIFLDSALSLKKLSAMIETNQTYVSNVVNKYFGCNLKELINSYRIEYAKELLGVRTCTLVEIPRLCGFASKSAFYSAFNKLEGSTPMRYLARLQQGN